MPTLTRYVLAELIKIFLVAVTALTTMMLTVGVLKEALAQGLPLAQVLRLIPYVLPDALRVALPVTLLLAVSFVFGRMAGANEVVAIKALGIPPWVVLVPAYVMAFLLSLATFCLNDIAVSWGRNGVQRVVTEALEEIIYGMLRAQQCYSAPGNRFAIHVKRVEGHKLIRVTLSVQGSGRTSGVVINADEAEIFSSPAENVLRVVLHNGKMDFEGRASLTFSDYQEHEIHLPDATKENLSVVPSWLPLRLIPDHIDEQRRDISAYQQELAARVALHVVNGEFDELTNPFWTGAMSNLASKWNHLFRLQTEEPRRWATAFSCLFFVWVGAPMAIRLRNGDLLTSFFLCFMPILVVYYPLMVYGVDGAKHGTIPPYSVWAGNVLLALWGTYLLRKVVRY